MCCSLTKTFLVNLCGDLARLDNDGIYGEGFPISHRVWTFGLEKVLDCFKDYCR